MCKNFYWSFFRNTGALCRKACAWIPELAGDILDGYYVPADGRPGMQEALQQLSDETL